MQDWCLGGCLSGVLRCVSLVSMDTIVHINPRLNNWGSWQSCRDTSPWVFPERTRLYWASLSLGLHSSQPEDRSGLSSLCAGHTLANSEVRAPPGVLRGWYIQQRKLVSSCSGQTRCAAKVSPETMSRDTYVVGVPGIPDMLHGFETRYSAAKSLILLCDLLPPEPLTAGRHARRAVWPFLSSDRLMLCNIFRSWFLSPSYEF